MARVKVRDQYQAEHWIDEAQLAFEPWRSYEVLEREGDQPAVEVDPTASKPKVTESNKAGDQRISAKTSPKPGKIEDK